MNPAPVTFAGMLAFGLALCPAGVMAASGPLGIDHRLPYDNAGIWSRHNQLVLEDGVILTELAGGVWLGGENRLGKTFWQAIDSSAFTALTVQGMKYAFGRERPSQTDDPNRWFSNGQSFPSGEVALQASFVTPFILQYHEAHPWVWALEALPAYDAVARMKTWGHWQTDVLAGWAVGTLWGLYAHGRPTPFFLSIMPHGIMVGVHTSF